MKLKTLYKQTKTGAIQQYDIETIDNTYVVTQGQVDGKKQNYITKCKPKNVGRKNETSGAAQAKSEALSKHAKKIKAGYTLDPSGEVSVRLPMKVQMYAKHKKKVIFPCYESPKLNGVNGTYLWENDTLVLKSRGGENYPLIDQHLDDVMKIMTTLKTNELNGEIYIHGEALQDITSAVKKYNNLTSKLEFHIFDLPGFTCDYEDRLTLMRQIKDTRFIKVVPASKLATSHDHLNEVHDDYVKSGYEGLMVRNTTGKYVHNTRSNDIFKFKKAQDAEFQVIGFKLDKYDHAIFNCSCDKGRAEFDVKLKGTAVERLAMAADAESYIGKWLKVEFEVYSNANKPLKPVGIMFRECDAKGEPLE